MTRATCPDDRELLALAEGRLDVAATAPLLGHIEHCATCAEVLAQLLGPAAATTMRARPHRGEAAPRPADARLTSPLRLPCVDGGYRFTELVAEGGMGRVYRARDLELGRDVAIKIPRSTERALVGRFEREIALSARLQHPGVIPVHAAGQLADGAPFFVMRFVEGTRLDAAVARAAGLHDRLALVERVVAVIDTMTFVHDQRIAHRDLKPQNVLLGSFGETLIIDWGLAKEIVESPPGFSTSAGTVLGTPGYMAPEQAAGQASDLRADVYALGAILRYVTTGRAPGVHDERPTDLGPLRALVAVWDRAMAGDRDARYADARALGDAVRSAIAARAPAATPGRASGWYCAECGLRTDHGGACPRDRAPLREADELLGRTAGNYTLVARVGSGGMGDVVRAINPEIGAHVAVKLLHATASVGAAGLERFRTEARAANRIEHDGVVRIVDAGQLDTGRAYLVMELLDGEPLAAAMARGRIPSPRALQIVDELLAIVAAAHAKRTVHRDLKPANIFLMRSGRVRVLDFGIAKLLDDPGTVTRTGSMVGTPGYMAPEQIFAGAVDARTDLYAVGVILFELLTGNAPFTGPNPFTIAQAHVSAPVPHLPAGFAPALDAVVARALAKRPDARFVSADEMRAALQAAATPPSRKRRWLLGGAAALVTGGVLATAVALTHSDAPPTANASIARAPSPDAALPPAVAVALAAPDASAVVVDAPVPIDAPARTPRREVGQRTSPHDASSPAPTERDAPPAPPHPAPAEPSDARKAYNAQSRTISVRNFRALRDFDDVEQLATAFASDAVLTKMCFRIATWDPGTEPTPYASTYYFVSPSNAALDDAARALRSCEVRVRSTVPDRLTVDRGEFPGGGACARAHAVAFPRCTLGQVIERAMAKYQLEVPPGDFCWRGTWQLNTSGLGTVPDDC